MFASAADARFLVASMPTSVPDMELPSVQVPRSDVLAALVAAILGQWAVTWAWQQGGYCQLAAGWICIELAFYAYTRWRCVPPSNGFERPPPSGTDVRQNVPRWMCPVASEAIVVL